jgi:hypothetical protein
MSEAVVEPRQIYSYNFKVQDLQFASVALCHAVSHVTDFGHHNSHLGLSALVSSSRHALNLHDFPMWFQGYNSSCRCLVEDRSAREEH